MLRFESLFQTIGTVEQKPERYVRNETWYADLGDYKVRNRAEYGGIILPSVLDFEGADYISGPEKRPGMPPICPIMRQWTQAPVSPM